MQRLVSFDIDGTLVVGSPRGVITMNVVDEAIMDGYIVGSSCNRPIASQREIWQDHRIKPAFTVMKHELGLVKERFEADEYYHVGDAPMDRHYARMAGFRFIPVEVVPTNRLWLPHTVPYEEWGETWY